MAVSKTLYKSEKYIILLNDCMGSELSIYQWSPKKIVSGFYFKHVADISVNERKAPNHNLGYKYQLMWLDMRDFSKFSDDLKEYNYVFEEEIFNEEVLAEYYAHQVAKRLRFSK